jgi:hypothetical protein
LRNALRAYRRVVVRCAVFGHRYRFRAEGATMVWECERGCGAGGSKAYGTPADAVRYATAFDADPADAGARRPMLSTLPLWIARRLRKGRR